MPGKMPTPVQANATLNREMPVASGFNTPDGSIWAPGDSRRMPELLRLPEPDLILLDIQKTANAFRIGRVSRNNKCLSGCAGFTGPLGLCRCTGFYPIHGDPARLKKLAINPERHICIGTG
jgi:hypothetical protein